MADSSKDIQLRELKDMINDLKKTGKEAIASDKIRTQAYTAVVCIAVVSFTGFPLIVRPNKNE